MKTVWSCETSVIGTEAGASGAREPRPNQCVNAAWPRSALSAGSRASAFPPPNSTAGLLQTRLEVVWGRVAAILVSVALFVAWHLPTRFLLAHGVEGEAGNLGSVLLGTGIPVGIVVLILALAWDRRRNPPALIAIHGAIDTIPIVASMLQSTAIGQR